MYRTKKSVSRKRKQRSRRKIDFFLLFPFPFSCPQGVGERRRKGPTTYVDCLEIHQKWHFRSRIYVLYSPVFMKKFCIEKIVSNSFSVNELALVVRSTYKLEEGSLCLPLPPFPFPFPPSSSFRRFPRLPHLENAFGASGDRGGGIRKGKRGNKNKNTIHRSYGVIIPNMANT